MNFVSEMVHLFDVTKNVIKQILLKQFYQCLEHSMLFKRTKFHDCILSVTMRCQGLYYLNFTCDFPRLYFN